MKIHRIAACPITDPTRSWDGSPKPLGARIYIVRAPPEFKKLDFEISSPNLAAKANDSRKANSTLAEVHFPKNQDFPRQISWKTFPGFSRRRDQENPRVPNNSKPA